MEETAYLQRHQQFVSMIEDYEQKLKSLQAKIAAARSNIAGFNDRLVGAREVEEMRRKLESLGVGSHLNTLAATDTRQQIETQLKEAQHSLEGAEKDFASMIAERDAARHQWYVDTQTLEAQQERQMSDMQSQATKNQLRSDRVTLTAAEDSVVLSVARVSPGTVLQSGVELMTTVPVNAKLQVSAPVDGANAGFVQVGDKVTIKFATLPYFRYGYAEGHVQRISSDSFTDPTGGQTNPTTQTPTISSQAPQNLGTAPVYYYHASISIDQLQLKNPPESFRVMPGMPIEADILVGKRSIMDYFFERYMPFMSQGMREPT
jgi:HlyD family secretion protein